ncbi:MAG: hypothetical protein ACJ731_10405 [Vicinamibacterales bacterium]
MSRPSDTALPPSSPHGERGSVLLCALMVVALIATLGAALALVVSTESAVAGNYAGSQQGLYAAQAGIERAIGEIRRLPTWSALPAPSSTASSADFNDGEAMPRGPDGSTLNLAQLTIQRQAESDAMRPTAPDRPVWRLYAHAPFARMAAAAGTAAPYVVVWLADDPDDLDGDPAVDTNDVVIIHAEAFGVRAGRHAIDVTIQREEAMAGGFPGVMRSDVRVIAWHEGR